MSAEVAKQLLESTLAAQKAVEEAAALHRKLLHSKHRDVGFLRALDGLDLVLTGDRARLTREEILNK